MQCHTLRLQPSGFTVSYYRAGQGEPLCYLHSILSMQGWEPMLAELATSFEVIAPYLPGWGPSDDSQALENALDITLFVRDFLEAAGLSRVHLLGVSIGAWMAAEMAAIFPERVRTLSLINPLGLWLDDTPGEDLFAQHPLRPTERLFADPASRERCLFGDRDDKVEVQLQELHDLKAAAKFLWPIPDTGVRKRLPRIQAPTLIATSAHDTVVVPPYGAAWQQAIRGAQLTTLAESGHLAHLEQPQACAHLITSFIGGHA